MADLRGVLEDLGHEDVRTHLQSGNAVVRTTGSICRGGEAGGRGSSVTRLAELAAG